MTTVAQVLQEKGCAVWSIAPDATVYAALESMAEKDIGALLVVAGDELVGIISERDYARKVVLKGRLSKDTCVRGIMSEKVVCVYPEQTIEDCMALMTAKRVRHLPVLADDKLVGVISIGDVVKAVIADQEFLIEELEKYITGSRTL
ncbi:MAG: CBS domain-containing protein [Chloroflexota bacterium]|nr:CBS domain-containing protein [Chloroflexota bacterium]